MKNIVRLSLVTVVGVLLIISCSPYYFSDDYFIRYEITGTAGSVDITMSNEDDGTSQLSRVNVPWEHEFRRSGFVYVSAQNNDDSGTVIAKIWIRKTPTQDWEIYKTSESSGAYVIATSSGSL